MARRRALRLSTRVTLFFAITALLGGIGLTVTTYLFARNSLLDQRTVSAETAARDNALDLNDSLGGDLATITDAVFALDTDPDGWAILITAGRGNIDPNTIPTNVGFSIDDFPPELVRTVERGQSGRQFFTDEDGEPWLGVGYAMNAYDAGYLEAFPLNDTERTLRLLATALIVGSVLAALLATFFGWSTSRRLLRPLSRVADAAGTIAHGGLDTRLEVETDPDLNRLAGSFNEMADAVQERIEREQRFASDVSHELRSPITALTAAVEVLDARRLDAGATDLNPEVVDLVDLCDKVSQRYGYGDLPIEVHRRAKREALVDRVRFERILGNLLENATTHGGGPVRITIEPSPLKRSVLMAVEDEGPGVAASERNRIFERFARGSAARHRIGTGLGLALVAEHAAALGGEAWVEDRPGGGARFVVRLPTEAP
jgi:signal transduction histidine kinase